MGTSFMGFGNRMAGCFSFRKRWRAKRLARGWREVSKSAAEGARLGPVGFGGTGEPLAFPPSLRDSRAIILHFTVPTIK